MALQKTPPLGWPHTESLEYQQGQPLVAPATAAGAAPPGTKHHKSRSCCSIVFLLMLLAVAGIALAIAVGVASLDDVLPSDDFEAAENAFLEQHPTWEVEVSDYPDSGSSTVRLVAWDRQRGIGRLVLMDPDAESSSTWYERPFVPGASTQSQEALLDAFAATFSQGSWAYLSEAEPLDTSSSPEQWLVRYQVWADDTDAWTGSRQAVAERDVATDVWVVYDRQASSAETSATP